MSVRKLLLGLLLCLPVAAHAAAVNFIACTSDSTNTPNATAAFTPTAGRLLVVTSTMSGSVTGIGSTAISSLGGDTYTAVAVAGYPATSTNHIMVWVANQTATASSQTISIDAADTGTGTNTCVFELSGMSRVGSDAVEQVSASDNDNSAGATPTMVFGASVLTGNPTLAAIVVALEAPALTVATGWTDVTSAVGHATPSQGTEVGTRDSGFTSTTITWNSTYGGNGAAVAVEFDATAVGASFTAGPAQVAVTTTTAQVSFTSDTNGTVEGVACANGSGLPTAVEILADQCSGGGAAVSHFDEVVVAGIADGETFTGLLPGTIYDTYYVIDAADDSSVASLADQTTSSVAFSAGPANNGVTDSTLAISFTTNISGTVEGVACPDGQTAPTAVQVLADQCTGDVAAEAHFDEVVVVDIADGETFTGLDPSTTYDTHYVIDGTGDSGVISLANQTTTGAGEPTFTSGPTETPLADGYTIAGTITCTGTCTVEAVACSPGDAAPTSTEIEAGQCGGGNAALMNASEVWTSTVANDFTLTSANKPPRLSVYVSGTDGTNDTAVTSLTSQDRSARSGFAIHELTSISTTSIFILNDYFDPNVSAGTVIEYEDDTNESADCNVSFEADGDFTLTPVAAGDCDGVRSFEISYEDVTSATTGLFAAPASVGIFSADDTVYVNNTPPVCSPDAGDAIVTLTQNVAMAAKDLGVLGGCDDADSDVLTYTVTTGTLPTGTALSGTGDKDWTGTPTVENEAGTAITITATDPAGDSDTYTFTVFVIATWIVPDLDNMTTEEAEDAIIAAAPWRDGNVGMTITGYVCGSGQSFLNIATQDPTALATAGAFDPVEVEIVGAIMPDLVGMTEAEAIAEIDALCP